MAYISKGLRGGKVLISGGYRYHKNIETNDKIWWRCWRKTCRATLSTNIFDLKDDNPIITVLEVSFRTYDYCNNVLSLNLMINLLNRSALLHWF